MIVLPLGWTGSAYQVPRAPGGRRRGRVRVPAGRLQQAPRRAPARRARGRDHDIVLALGWTGGAYGRGGGRRAA